jgi:2,3-dihydroxy-p-cumate/2,3-dihydroxybenzoate 3,4-dioxygenase
MVNEIDDIGRLFNRAKTMNVDIHFGIGRHPTSGSIHLYIYDHDNFVWEYTLGMEQFPETGAREPRRMSSEPKDFDLWGAVPDNSRKDELPEVLTRLPTRLEAVPSKAP